MDRWLSGGAIGRWRLRSRGLVDIRPLKPLKRQLDASERLPVEIVDR